ncbi:MAG: hypothetical protein RIC35_24355 [Marinoscillum sp.]
MTKEAQIEQQLISLLEDLKYTYRSDIRDRASLEVISEPNLNRSTAR